MEVLDTRNPTPTSANEILHLNDISFFMSFGENIEVNMTLLDTMSSLIEGDVRLDDV